MKDLIAAARAATLPFLLSRALIAAILLCACALHMSPVPAREGSILHGYAAIKNGDTAVKLKTVLLSGDAFWYLQISQNGYDAGRVDKGAPKNWVFFPLYPLLIRGVAKVVRSPLIAALLISQAAYFAGLCGLYLLLGLLPLEKSRQEGALWLSCFFPTSYFYSAPFTESLFFALVVFTFLCLGKQRPLSAGALFALAMICRPTGMLLYPAFLLGLIGQPREMRRRAAAAAVAAPLGLLGFMLHLKLVSGSAVSFLTNQGAWGRGTAAAWHKLYDDLIIQRLVLRDWSFDLLHISVLMITLLITARFIRQRRYALAVMLAVPAAAAVATGTLLSLTRILMPLPALSIGLAEFADSEKKRTALLVVFTAVLALLSGMYAGLITAGMT